MYSRLKEHRDITRLIVFLMVFVLLIRAAAICGTIWTAFHQQWLNAISLFLINEFLGWVVRQIGEPDVTSKNNASRESSRGNNSSANLSSL